MSTLSTSLRDFLSQLELPRDVALVSDHAVSPRSSRRTFRVVHIDTISSVPCRWTGGGNVESSGVSQAAKESLSSIGSSSAAAPSPPTNVGVVSPPRVPQRCPSPRKQSKTTMRPTIMNEESNTSASATLPLCYALLMDHMHQECLAPASKQRQESIRPCSLSA